MKPDRLPGTKVRELLEKYGLQGERAIVVAADLINYKPQTIKAMNSRTIRLNDYELLQYKLMVHYSAWRKK